jgi:hypothetical protein
MSHKSITDNIFEGQTVINGLLGEVKLAPSFYIMQDKPSIIPNSSNNSFQNTQSPFNTQIKIYKPIFINNLDLLIKTVEYIEKQQIEKII